MPRGRNSGAQTDNLFDRFVDAERRSVDLQGYGVVERPAFGEETRHALADLASRQQRTPGISGNAFQYGLGRRPQTDDAAGSQKVLHVLGVQDHTASGGNHPAAAAGEFAHEIPFPLPEKAFSVPGENVGNGPPFPLFDQLVHVAENHARPFGKLLADCGLARSHEAEQDDVVACALHDCVSGDRLPSNGDCVKRRGAPAERQAHIRHLQQPLLALKISAN